MVEVDRAVDFVAQNGCSSIRLECLSCRAVLLGNPDFAKSVVDHTGSEAHGKPCCSPEIGRHSLLGPESASHSLPNSEPGIGFDGLGKEAAVSAVIDTVCCEKKSHCTQAVGIAEAAAVFAEKKAHCT